MAKMELIDDDGTYQSVYLPRGSAFLETGWGQFVNAEEKPRWTIDRWRKKGGSAFDRNARSHHGTGLVNNPTIMVTTLEVFPRKNQWGDICP